MQQARVRLAGTSPEDLDDICADVREIADSTGLPCQARSRYRRRRSRSRRESPRTVRGRRREHWEMRVHKRLIDIDADERALRQLMRVQVPNDVSIEIVLED